ncbi:unnamed protein product [Orchesella dallaii]|uniref:F-box domain-containing protein n=1 Tax=Orchesella dallaii TaxID=48710 RepID=A0ABP1PLE3_9HEXA
MEVLDYCHFPAENILQIWLNIYEKLGEEDKVTFSRACAEWHDLVARKRTAILFPQVAVFLLRRIPTSSIKQCRAVCQSWAQKIDSLHEYYPSDPLFYMGTEYEEVGSCEEALNYEFGSADEIERFMADMSGHPGNPLPGRDISFEWKVLEREEELGPREKSRIRMQYWTAVTVLLSKFGKYILDASFVFGEDEEEYEFLVVQIVDRFRNCLLSLPNLQCLTLYSLETGLEVEVQEDLRLNPLPRLQNLEAVEIHDVEDCIAEAFLNSCLVPASVKVVCINPPRVPPVVYSFYNLESLTVRSCFFKIEDLERFRNLPQVPPLRVLSVRFWSAMSALQVFTALEPFADTLTEVFIISRRNPVYGINGQRVNLPKLEKLYLDSYRGSFDLFMGLTSLKKLVIDKAYIRRRKRTNEVAQICEFERRLNESNIWERLPALEVIVVGNGNNMKVYER